MDKHVSLFRLMGFNSGLLEGISFPLGLRTPEDALVFGTGKDQTIAYFKWI